MTSSLRWKIPAGTLGLVGRFASPRSGSGSLAKTAFVTAIILPAISRARQAARRTKCMNNLREIAAGLGTWEKGHDGELPDSLGDLHPDYLVSPDILTCPSDDDPFRLENGLECSYRYAGNLGGITSRQGAVVIAYDDPDNHGRGRNRPKPAGVFQTELSRGANTLSWARATF